MEELIKQRRVSFPGQPQAQDNHDNIRERKLPRRQQAESFKGDDKGQKWFRRQFSSKMSRDYDASDGEFVTAIAAASYAIFSHEEASTSQYENRIRRNDAALGQSSGRISRRLSNKESKSAGEASIRKSMGQDRKAPENYIVPPGKPSRSSSIKPSSTRNNSVETKANAWEKSQMEKIKRRSEKMKTAILAWENEKKMKAKFKLDKKKRELELRTERNLQHYKMKIASIDKIGGGARAQVEEKRRNEESVVKEKAKRIRSTGKAPVTCFCF